MDDFTPPSGPPPPKAPEVPAGWAARWNEQYKEWFYVNLYTKQSQWDKPTVPVFPASDVPGGPPPGYHPGDGPAPTDTKKNPYDDHSNPNYGATGGSSSLDEDARLAAQLQAEEDARARSGHGGAQPPAGYGSSSAGYGGNSPFPQNTSSYQQELPAQDKGKSGGFLGKLLGKVASKQSSHGSHGGGYGGYQQQQQYYPQQGHGFPGHGLPMGFGGQPGYGQHHGAPGGYGGYGGGYGQPQRKPGGGGLGLAGGAALGLGAGVVGGMLLEDAIDDGQQDAYQDGYQDGDNGGDGGDYGGDDGGGE